MSIEENTNVYNSISSKLATLSIETVKNFESDDHHDNPDEYIKVRRALSKAAKSLIFTASRRVDFDTPIADEGYLNELKRRACLELAETLLKEGLFEIQEVDAWKNMDIARKSYVITLPVFDWRDSE